MAGRPLRRWYQPDLARPNVWRYRQRRKDGTIENLTLTGVHAAEACAGRPCPIHAPSDHHMRGWPIHWRGDRGIIERICADHGIGHPDPDQIGDKVHGCDGCCRAPEASAP